jgi:serine protease Do
LLLQTIVITNSSPAVAGTNPPPKLNLQDTPLSREVKASTSFAPVIKKAAPSVVSIYTTTNIRNRGQANPFLSDPLLRRWFGEEFGSRAFPQQRRTQNNLGSGVIVSTEGYVLTASHVIEGADEIQVALASGEECKANVIGSDPPTDIAVLRIESKKTLPAAVLADSDKLEVGDLVLAMGNPFDVGQTVTLGLVSALGRGGFRISGYENFIQTDAAINPGNSGGPLLDAEGRVVGINTAIISPSGGFNGVGFAVPVNMARFVMERLIKDGVVTRGYLGVNMQPLTPDLAKVFGLPEDSAGVLVGGVMPDSAAEKAGVKDGDLIVEVAGKKVTDPRNLQLIVSQTAPGTKVTIKVLRSNDGKKATEKVLGASLGELPAELSGTRRGGPAQPEEPEVDALDGVEVTDLDSRTRKELGAPSSLQGALVTSVNPDSNSAEAGLRTGDIIVEINRQPVTNAQQVVTLSNRVKNDKILLRIWSGGRGSPGGTRYLVVENTKRK